MNTTNIASSILYQEGNYTCVATSKYGTDEKHFAIKGGEKMRYFETNPMQRVAKRVFGGRGKSCVILRDRAELWAKIEMVTRGRFGLHPLDYWTESGSKASAASLAGWDFHLSRPLSASFSTCYFFQLNITQQARYELRKHLQHLCYSLRYRHIFLWKLHFPETCATDNCFHACEGHNLAFEFIWVFMTTFIKCKWYTDIFPV